MKQGKVKRTISLRAGEGGRGISSSGRRLAGGLRSRVRTASVGERVAHEAGDDSDVISGAVVVSCRCIGQ